ncbi:MAG: DNA polymerase III subunit beta [Gammaproteobacteria bacterium]|nr:DNA polymerase III subunit beta [Gammaproteobacteria bacterium]
MKLTIKRETLLKPLQMVSGVVSERRQTMPILSHLLFSIQSNKLFITGTDIEVELLGITDLEESAPNAEITIPGRKLIDICRALPENSILNLSESNNKVTIVSGRSRFSLATLPARNFPRTPEQDTVMTFNITQKALRNLIEKTAFAIPQQDVRQYLNGLLIEVKDGVIQVLATDGHRLALNSIETAIVDNSFAQVIVPRKGIFELQRLLTDSEEEVAISLNSNFIRVQGGDFVLISKLINGKFPNYNKILPKRGDKRIELNRNELKQSLIRVGILSNEIFRSTKFQLRDGILQLASNNPEQEEASEEISVDYHGDNIETIFNITYLLDIINAVNTDKISISLKDGESGAIIEEVNGSSNCVHVIMPIRQ